MAVKMRQQKLLIHPHPLWNNCRAWALDGEGVHIVTLSGMYRPRKVRNRPFMKATALYIKGRCTMYDYPFIGLN